MGKLLSASEIDSACDELMDRWGPNWRDNEAQRLALDTLHDAGVALRAYESAARQRDIAKRATEMAERICLPSIRAKGF